MLVRRLRVGYKMTIQEREKIIHALALNKLNDDISDAAKGLIYSIRRSELEKLSNEKLAEMHQGIKELTK